MAKITYLTGDATDPKGNGIRIITHVCNNVGAWGAGFVLVLSRKWKEPEKDYLLWHKTKFRDFRLGEVSFVSVGDNILVANMIAQNNIGHKYNNGAGGKPIPPIRYWALSLALNRVARYANAIGATVHMPRIGCGLAGGKWEEVEKIINHELINMGVDVYVYDLE